MKMRPDQISAFDPENMPILSCTQRDWDLATRLLDSNIVRMSTLATHHQGEVNETTHARFLSENKEGASVLRGAAITLYAVREASQGRLLFLQAKQFLNGASKVSKAWDHQSWRLGFQRKSPQNNFRRLIAAPIAPGQFCFDSVSYVSSASSKIDLNLLMVLLNSKILDWYFRLGSTNSSINEYQFNNLPVVQVSDDGTCLHAVEQLAGSGNWSELGEVLVGACPQRGIVPRSVAESLAMMSMEVQKIESERILSARSERSRLASESQPIQDALDRVLFHCYGLSEDDAQYIKKRLTEML